MLTQDTLNRIYQSLVDGGVFLRHAIGRTSFQETVLCLNCKGFDLNVRFGGRAKNKVDVHIYVKDMDMAHLCAKAREFADRNGLEMGKRSVGKTGVLVVKKYDCRWEEGVSDLIIDQISKLCDNLLAFMAGVNGANKSANKILTVPVDAERVVSNVCVMRRQGILRQDFLRMGLIRAQGATSTMRDDDVIRFSECLSGHILEDVRVATAKTKNGKDFSKISVKRSRRRLSYFELGVQELLVELSRLRVWVADVIESYKALHGIDVLEGERDVVDVCQAVELLINLNRKPEVVSTEMEKIVDEKISDYQKTRHIIKSFRHTHQKDYENYVITGVWHRLHSLGLSRNLKPVTQQYVRRDNGYALLDLYFPGLRFAIECDEAYHLRNSINDKERESEVFKAFEECFPDEKHMAAVIEDDLAMVSAESIDVHGLELARVDASVPYDMIDEQLDNIVNRIQKRFNELKPTWTVRPAEEVLLSCNRLSTAQQLVFDNIPAVLRGMRITRSDGENISNWWKGGWPVTNRDFVILWFPQLSKEGGKWENILEANGQSIRENRSEKGFGEKAKRDWLNDADALDKGCHSIRIVFAHSRNSIGETGYRFMGVFRLKEYGRRDAEGFPTYLKWEKMSDEVVVDEDWNKVVQFVKSRFFS